MMVQTLHRASMASHASGHPRTTFDAKKLLTLWTLLCGGVAILLWGFFSFPKKFAVTRTAKNKTCDDEIKMCMNGWNKIHRTCFFIFQHKNSWTTAQENCIFYDANLAKLSSKKELEALMGHVQALHTSAWIGLSKRNLRKAWVWTDGSRYNDLKKIQDHGDCAFIRKNGIDSTTCDDLKDYICAKAGQCP